LITILDEIIRPSLTNWTEFGKLIDKSSNDLLSVAHKTVETRLAFANTHLVILRQVNNNTLKRAMFENIIINLVSSLQSVAHVINERYTVGINYKVEIDHKYYKREKKHLEASKICLRCKLKTVNTTLAELLDGDINHWQSSKPLV
jgi:hypothetical protein